jgi:hypothetical protein
MVIFFNLCLILAIIFSKFLKPNAERKKKGGGGGRGRAAKEKEK